MKKRVLWFSRHKMDIDQTTALKNKIGEFDIIQLDKTLDSAYDIISLISSCDVVAVVAPPELLVEFTEICSAQNKPLIFSKSERILTKDVGDSESKVVFKFVNWVEVTKFIYETEIFC